MATVVRGNRGGAGDVKATVEPEARFRALFAETYEPIQAYVRRRTAVADADDVVAEVFATAWRRLADVPVDRPLPWLYGVARRVLANQRRSTRRRFRLLRRLEGQPAVAVVTSAGADGAADGTDLAIIEALGRLRADDQEVLRLAAWEQLRAAEIALVLGCSPNAAALRLSRARRRLREALTEQDRVRTQVIRRTTDA